MVVEDGPPDQGLEHAQVDLVRGQVAFASSAGSEAPALVWKAAKRIEPLDVGLARETYLDAWAAASFAGRLARAGEIRDVSRAARSAAQAASGPRPSDLLLDGLAVLVTEGRGAAASILRRGLPGSPRKRSAVRTGSDGDGSPRSPQSCCGTRRPGTRLRIGSSQTACEAGLLVDLLIYVNQVAMNATWRGDLAAAASLTAEGDAIAEAKVHPLRPVRGRYARWPSRFASRGDQADRGCDDGRAKLLDKAWGFEVCHWVSSILYNALGRYEDALSEAEQAAEDTPEPARFCVGASRADRGGHENRCNPARCRGAGATGRGDERRRH